MNNKLYNKILIASMGCLMLSACSKKSDKFFQLRDRGGIDAAIWSNEGAIQYHLNEAYDVIMPHFAYEAFPSGANLEIHYASDENYWAANTDRARRTLGLQGSLAANDIRYIGFKYQGANYGDNRYFDIARTNNGIKYIPEGNLPAETKRRFLGQYYALRAMAYLDLAKIYGGMPLVLEPQNPSNLTLSGRASARQMFEQIVKDCDSAMVNLEGVTWVGDGQIGKLTKTAAAALKAEALLCWASPQFNPRDAAAHPYDASRWQTAFEACKAAYTIAIDNGKALMPTYESIFRTEGDANTEAIIIRSYSPTVAKRGHNVEYRSRPMSAGGSPSDIYYASTRLLDAYTMKDGTPINASGSGYNALLFWKDRDPRFEATIAYNGSTWNLGGSTNRKQWTYKTAIGETGDRGVYCKRFTTPALANGAVRNQNDFGGSGMDWIELRLADVMLNYAEAANEVGNIDVAKEMVKKLRQRAGIIAGANDYGLNLAVSVDQMRDLILNERFVEFAFEGKRVEDLRRTRRYHLMNGTLTGLQVVLKESAYKAILEDTTNRITGTTYRDGLDMNNMDTVSKYFTYQFVLPSGNGGFSVPQENYFYPLSDFFIKSSPLLEQTIGWNGGLFDPLK
ncbi:RagB/SusD family nutrient uptake outer membrane protein [Niabella yanshanensis]|uniref:RagB/SusD family nutrient uptake outer membrane protein n=1 Tax=Niabella yanshanensis TaxID=577386 RepID=A0ABZ0W8J8_9BACT|nr:RagB/SusD family nutrient uptake outer membrane protein [Niabella yanshanensis]WQD39264.1 RagB/SusD family nutrient uptake outer membrane protein [Niabella yanshanensis]